MNEHLLIRTFAYAIANNHHQHQHYSHRWRMLACFLLSISYEKAPYTLIHVFSAFKVDIFVAYVHEIGIFQCFVLLFFSFLQRFSLCDNQIFRPLITWFTIITRRKNSMQKWQQDSYSHWVFCWKLDRLKILHARKSEFFFEYFHKILS